MHNVYKLKETLCKELEEYGNKEKIDANTLEVVDKLAHAIKNIDKIIETYEEQESGGSFARGGNSYGMMPQYAYDDMSYARGRGRNARRDSMGRYSSRNDGGYSNADGYRMDMQDMPDFYSRRNNMMDGM